MIFLSLAWKSLRSRTFSTSLTVLSIALSVALLLTVERAQRSSKEGFMSAISRTDLIVGGRTGPTQLLLFSVFNVGNATHNISWESYQHWAKHPAVEWTIPYSLGDSHRGFRVVATNQDFFEHYRFRGDRSPEFEIGAAFQNLWDVVVGSEVARRLNYQLGNSITLSHGATKGESFQEHGDKPFRITGILKSTGTPIDQSVYISLPAMEAIHIDWKTGAAPTDKTRISPDQIKAEDLKTETITAFFLRTKSRLDTLKLQREINVYPEEALLSILPGATLQELWRVIGYAERVLSLVSILVLVVGFSAMLIALVTTLNERRREMAILRSLGAGQSRIAGLLVFEAALLTTFGVALGVVVNLSVFVILGPWLENEFGLYLVGAIFSVREMVMIGIVLLGGVLAGLIPALKARQQALKDGLTGL